MKKTLFLTALLLAPALLALKPAAVRLKFAPADGTSLTKTFETKGTLSLTSFELKGAGVTPDIELTLNTSQKIVVTDDYATVKSGRPWKLTRSFDELGGSSSAAMKMSVMGQSQDNEQNNQMKSELTGKKVVFTWDADKSEYSKAFEPAEDKKDLLENLAEDMDLRALLPETEVGEGDEWKPVVSDLRSLFAPGGSLALVPEASDDESMQMGNEMGSLAESIGEKLEGEATAKLVSIKEVDGRSCATIHLTLKVNAAADLTEVTRKMLEKRGTPQQVDSLEIDHVDMEFRFEGEGDLVWDIAGGHFRSFELTGQTVIKNETGTKISVQGKELTIEDSREMSGSTTYTASAK